MQHLIWSSSVNWHHPVVLGIRGVSEKYPDCVHKNFILKYSKKLSPLPFKVTPSESNTLLHPLLPCVHALLEGILRSSVVTAVLMVSTSEKCVPLITSFSLGNRKKSHGARSGEYGGWSRTATFFSAKNWRMLRALWAGALSWWSVHELSNHKSLLFSRTDRNKRRKISL